MCCTMFSGQDVERVSSGLGELHCVFLWNVVAVLYEVFRPISTESSIRWTVVVQMFN